MFGIKNSLKRSHPKQKVSEMLLNAANEFISMGEDIAEKQEYLNCAVSAWNMACLSEAHREKAMKKYMKAYKKLNPTFSKKDFKDEEENIRLLIKQKQKLYPKVKIQIANAMIQEIDGQNHVTVASIGTR